MTFEEQFYGLLENTKTETKEQKMYLIERLTDLKEQTKNKRLQRAVVDEINILVMGLNDEIRI